MGFKPLPALPTPAGEASRGLLTQPPASMQWASLGSGGNSLNFFGVVDDCGGGDDDDNHDEEGGQPLALLLTYFSDQGSPGGQECVYYHPVPRLGTAWI